MRFSIPDGKRVAVPNDLRLNTFGYMPTDAYIWWDGGDSSVITIDSGVSVLADKGSAGFDLTQPTQSQQPAYNVNQQNYLPVLSFDKTENQCLTITTASLGIDNAVVSVAFKPIIIGKTYESILAYSGNDNDFQFDANGATDWYGRFNSAGYSNQDFSTAILTNVPQILTIVGDVTKGILEGYLNENKVWETTGYTGWDNTDITIGIALNRSGNRFLTCDFYEMVVTQPEDAANLIEYLRHKWAI